MSPSNAKPKSKARQLIEKHRNMQKLQSDNNRKNTIQFSPEAKKDSITRLDGFMSPQHYNQSTLVKRNSIRRDTLLEEMMNMSSNL